MSEIVMAPGQKATPLRWYQYSQNNSGGSFDHDPERGIGKAVWVQARDAEEANYKAQRIGLYFDGYGDCSCCGNRWYEKNDYRGVGSDAENEEPHIYSEYDSMWGVPSYAHRADGTFYVITEDKTTPERRAELELRRRGYIQ